MDLLTIGLGLVGLVLLATGGDALVRGSASLAVSRGVSRLVVGLTVVAFGTSAPEATVSITSAFAGNADVAYGNVIGSNIFNVLGILGLCAVIAPIVVSRQLLWFDVPVMIGAALLAWAFAADGRIGRLEGAGLLAGLVAYTWVQIRLARRGVSAPIEEVGGPKTLPAQLAFILGGLGLLLLGSHWFVEASVAVARSLGVSDLVVGLTIVAMGTSAPEVATSLVALRRGQGDIAVGNVVGSNVFNVLGALGAAAAIAPDGVAVAPSALAFDTPYMVAALGACLPIALVRHRIDRWAGWLFLVSYAAYTTYLVLDATKHDALRGFSWVAFNFIAPLVGATILVIALRALWAARRAPKAAGDDPAAP